MRVIFNAKTLVPSKDGSTVEDVPVKLLLETNLVFAVSEGFSSGFDPICIIYTPMGKFVVDEGFSEVMSKIGVDFEDGSVYSLL